MKMTRIEKQFVNRKKQAKQNIKNLECALEYIDMKKIKIALELGCGIGFVSHHLAKTYNFKVYGTDYDNEQIHIATQMQPDIDHLSFQVEDAAKLSFENSSIDLVISQNIFHHIPHWKNAIQEIARVLCSGGYVVWSDITFPRIVKTIFLPFIKNYGLYTINDIENAFAFHEFKKLFYEQLAHGPLSQHQYVLQHN